MGYDSTEHLQRVRNMKGTMRGTQGNNGVLRHETRYITMTDTAQRGDTVRSMSEYRGLR
jgi:hypothetical protein